MSLPFSPIVTQHKVPNFPLSRMVGERLRSLRTKQHKSGPGKISKEGRRARKLLKPALFVERPVSTAKMMPGKEFFRGEEAKSEQTRGQDLRCVFQQTHVKTPRLAVGEGTLGGGCDKESVWLGSPVSLTGVAPGGNP